MTKWEEDTPLYPIEMTDPVDRSSTATIEREWHMAEGFHEDDPYHEPKYDYEGHIDYLRRSNGGHIYRWYLFAKRDRGVYVGSSGTSDTFDGACSGFDDEFSKAKRLRRTAGFCHV